jgi:thiaminase/transcriptional activator TenA
LIEGTLDADRFRFYQMQDARYLEAFADACSLISVRCPEPADKLWFVDAARLALVVEQELHSGYGKQLGYTPEDVRNLDLTPNARAYSSHMVASAQAGSLLVALAALAPCPWLYTEVGMGLPAYPESHPYAAWLATYADTGFIEYTNALLGRLEGQAAHASAEDRDAAKKAFRASVRYEWMFWEQAWTRQEWPV